ncbi:MAG: radical SAM protein [Candidatus Thorarchaeota archaeon]|nr:radical SAM protein [Candidatus Thorarchaeota archaeon]
MNTEELLRLKIRLLTQGATVIKKELKGRRGGAGPVGARYFIIPNGRPVGVPLRSGKQAEVFHSATLEPTEDPLVWIYDGAVELRAVPTPKFLGMKTADGIEYRKIALLHGSETLATTAYQACRYWAHGSQCKFCTIPVSLNAGDTILDKQPEQVAEVVMAAEREGVIKNILITTGTPDAPDVGTNRLVRIIKKIREVSDLPIGVQFEPPTEMRYIENVATAGANAVGIHIESADDEVRKRVCPGKHEYGPLNLYRQAWDTALDYFDRGNVSTFLLYGLGEDQATTLSFIQELSELGIMTVVTPFRPAYGSQLANYIPPYVSDLEGAIAFYKNVGRILYDNDLNPDKTVAGCHKCGGCTPIQEAFDWAKTHQ